MIPLSRLLVPSRLALLGAEVFDRFVVRYRIGEDG